MAQQVLGRYIKQKRKLLREAESTAELIRSSLKERYGNRLANEILKDVLEEYEKLIPEIPSIKRFKGRMFNSFFVISAQALALYKAMHSYGKSASEAWEICHIALRRRMSKMSGFQMLRPRFLRWLLFSVIARRAFVRREKRQERALLGGFELEYLGGEGRDFDLGVNYHQCGILDFMKKHDAEEFAPFCCMSDIALSDATRLVQ